VYAGGEDTHTFRRMCGHHTVTEVRDVAVDTEGVDHGLSATGELLSGGVQGAGIQVALECDGSGGALADVGLGVLLDLRNDDGVLGKLACGFRDDGPVEGECVVLEGGQPGDSIGGGAREAGDAHVVILDDGAISGAGLGDLTLDAGLAESLLDAGGDLRKVRQRKLAEQSRGQLASVGLKDLEHLRAGLGLTDEKLHAGVGDGLQHALGGLGVLVKEALERVHGPPQKPMRGTRPLSSCLVTAMASYT